MEAETFLKLMQNHEKNEIWFSSLIRFFYQHGIGCNFTKDKALKMYLLAIKQDNVQTFNIIIAKYLLSLFYYKDIILVKRGSVNLTIVNPLKSKIIISRVESNTNKVKDNESREDLESRDLHTNNNNSENESKIIISQFENLDEPDTNKDNESREDLESQDLNMNNNSESESKIIISQFENLDESNTNKDDKSKRY